ncbi:MAG: hypothetical protein K9K37_07790 [Desulfocapsa sp.]|nr:hypothetical protein [Desulfocapsa sp.]
MELSDSPGTAVTKSSDTWRDIGWNSLTLSCPGNWEAIVSGDNHLLFEKHFQPVLEVRWQKQDKISRKVTDTIRRKLQQETELFPDKTIPAFWKELKNSYTVQLFRDNKHDAPKAALLTCHQCGTTLLFYFFKTLSPHHSDFITILSSLRCHGQEGDHRLWSVQDFQILLPESFKLSSHSFKAGLTRLSYIDSGLTMHLCRLTSAVQRLEKATPAELMVLLGDVSVPEEEIHRNAHSVSHFNRPSIFSQIMSRLKRKAPFHWMILRHHPDLDRLSGLFFFDKKPFPEKTISSILDSYELFCP